jgi:hypothetical protein
MGTSNYSDEFKRDAVHQITVRGIPCGRFPGVWESAPILCTSG